MRPFRWHAGFRPRGQARPLRDSGRRPRRARPGLRWGSGDSGLLDAPTGGGWARHPARTVRGSDRGQLPGPAHHPISDRGSSLRVLPAVSELSWKSRASSGWRGVGQPYRLVRPGVHSAADSRASTGHCGGPAARPSRPSRGGRAAVRRQRVRNPGAPGVDASASTHRLRGRAGAGLAWPGRFTRRPTQRLGPVRGSRTSAAMPLHGRCAGPDTTC
jgi:hypothetical protein